MRDANSRQADASDSLGCVVAFPIRAESCAGGDDVERINQFGLIEIGEKLQELKAFKGEVSADDAFFPCLSAQDAIGELLNGDPIELAVSRASAIRLAESLASVINEHFRATSPEGKAIWKFPSEDTPPIPDWKWSGVKTAIGSFETILREEMRDAAVYRVPARGIFDTAKLIDSADRTFPPDLHPYIPQKTRDDWCAAGRCLAFNLSSASGFHVARAVEGTLEAYYQQATGKTKTLNGWNDYIKALEAAAANPTGALVPSEKVISHLRQMKDDYRNPIVHPRVVLTEPDARMLFANGESVIMAMALEIKAATPAPLVVNALAGLGAAALGVRIG